jgi:uncharacterized phiE125 gp8 family phage protein
MALKLITAPAVNPISLVEAKAHLRVDHSQEDTLIELFVKAATQNAEAFLGRALVTQTWELVLDSFPTEEVKIPLPPLQSVVSIKYDDSAGDEQTLATDQYVVDTASEPGWVVPLTAGWPSTIDAINAVRIQFVAGYPPTSDSPPDLTANILFSIKAAILLNLGSLYANRETVVIGQTTAHLPWGAEQLLRPHRVLLGMA